MKKAFNQFIILFLFTAILVLPYFTFAAVTTTNNPLGKLEQVGSTQGPYAAASQTSVSSIIGTVVNVALSLLGILFVVLIILAGYQWMTAAGNEEAIKKATGKMSNAIIGLVIVISAYAIWSFISYRLLQ